MMTKYLDCYFRVSTQEQTKGQSLDTQQEYGKIIAKKLGLTKNEIEFIDAMIRPME